MAKSGLTLDEVRAWGGDEVFSQGLEMVSKEAVVSVSYNADSKTVSGKFEGSDGWKVHIFFVLKENGGIESHCPCYQNQKLGRVCQHVVALGIALAIAETEGAGRHV